MCAGTFVKFVGFVRRAFPKSHLCPHLIRGHFLFIKNNGARSHY